MREFVIKVQLDKDKEASKTNVKQRKDDKLKIDSSKYMNANSIRKSAGKTLAVASLANSLVGDYTENRLLQRQINVGLGVAGFGLVLATGNPLLIAGASVGLAVVETKRRIKVRKNNIKADYLRNLTGNTSDSGSRFRGVNR